MLSERRETEFLKKHCSKLVTRNWISLMKNKIRKTREKCSTLMDATTESYMQNSTRSQNVIDPV